MTDTLDPKAIAEDVRAAHGDDAAREYLAHVDRLTGLTRDEFIAEFDPAPSYRGMRGGRFPVPSGNLCGWLLVDDDEAADLVEAGTLTSEQVAESKAARGAYLGDTATISASPV